jgi:hypothetical protein
VRDASGTFFCRFLKIISQMFDGFKEKCYLRRRDEEINDSYSQAGHGLRVARAEGMPSGCTGPFY